MGASRAGQAAASLAEPEFRKLHLGLGDLATYPREAFLEAAEAEQAFALDGGAPAVLRQKRPP